MTYFRCFGETLSTLNFAKRAKQIKNKVQLEEEEEDLISTLKLQIINIYNIYYTKIMVQANCNNPIGLE